MITRLWRGWTAIDNADAYEQFLLAELFPSMRDIPGFRGADVLRRAEHEEVAFVTLTRFESVDAIRAFAGDEYETPLGLGKRRTTPRRQPPAAAASGSVILPERQAAFRADDPGRHPRDAPRVLYPFPFDPKAAPSLPKAVQAHAYLTDGRSLFRVLSRRYQSDAPEAVLEDCRTLDVALYHSDKLCSMGLRPVHT